MNSALNTPSNPPAMKTKTLIVIGVIGMAAALAPKARAGWSIGISLDVPVAYSAPVYVAPPPPPIYTAPVYYAPPPVVYCQPPVTYCPPPVVYVAPRYGGHYDYRDYRGHDRGRYGRGWGHDARGYGYGGRR